MICSDRLAPKQMSLNDVEGHSPIVSFFKWYFSYSCSVFGKNSTDSVLVHCPSALAALLVWFTVQLYNLWSLLNYSNAILHCNNPALDKLQNCCSNWVLYKLENWSQFGHERQLIVRHEVSTARCWYEVTWRYSCDLCSLLFTLCCEWNENSIKNDR